MLNFAYNIFNISFYMFKLFMFKLSVVLVLIFVISCSSQAQYQQLAPQAFLTQFLQDSNAILLDVRTPGEIAQGHLKGAQFINFQDADFDAKIAALDKSKTIYTYCAVGGRSGRACNKLVALKCKAVNLEGGIEAWKAAGLELVKD